MPFRIAALQVDGSEFAAEFEQACQARSLPLFVLPPRSPKLNGHVERAHRTHNEEFYEVTPDRWNVPDLNPGAVRMPFQGSQVVRVITAPPAIEGLLADAEVPAGEGRVVPVLEVVRHPLQPQGGLTAQLPPRTRQLAGSRWLSPSNLHRDTLPECHQSF